MPSDDLIALFGSLFLRLIPLKFAYKQAQQISTPVTSILCFQGPPRPSCSAVRSTPRLLSQQRGCQRRPMATEQQLGSSLRAGSELTAKKG